MKWTLFLIGVLASASLPATARAGPISGTLTFNENGGFAVGSPLPPPQPPLAPLYVIPAGEAIDAGTVILNGTFFSAFNVVIDWQLSGFGIGQSTLNGAGFGTYSLNFTFDGNPAGLAALNTGTGFLTATNNIGSGGLLLGGTLGTATFAGNVSPVPEPSTFVLFGLGLLAAGRAARKRRLGLAKG